MRLASLVLRLVGTWIHKRVSSTHGLLRVVPRLNQTRLIPILLYVTQAAPQVAVSEPSHFAVVIGAVPTGR